MTTGMDAGADAATCVLVQSDQSFQGKQGLRYLTGISLESVGSHALCMHLLRMPPGARAKAHLHEAHETAIYVLSGVSEMWYGDMLEQHMVVPAGAFLYIPANVPHLPFNTGDEECVALIARTDPNEQESVKLLPELEAILDARLSVHERISTPTTSSSG